MDTSAIQELLDKETETIEKIKKEMSKIIIGQEKLIKCLLIAVFTGNHILLEGVPGLAKTTSISTLAQVLKLSFQRIQFTPDLLPSDLIGSKVFNPKDSSFYVKKGPVFANFILADEINRSPAKVQSALLEAMQEKQITIGDETFILESPFLVMATQNPIEQEGTYPLPEAQVDRFLLKTIINYPNPEEELAIINQAEITNKEKVKEILTGSKVLKIQELIKKIYIDESIKKYITDIVFTSRNSNDINDLKGLISCGASPRASIGLMHAAKAVAFLNNRSYVIPEDIKEISLEILRHRIIPTYEAEAEGVKNDDIVNILINNVKVP